MYGTDVICVLVSVVSVQKLFDKNLEQTTPTTETIQTKTTAYKKYHGPGHIHIRTDQYSNKHEKFG